MTASPQDRGRWDILLLVPDLPDADALLPYLREIDRNRWYSNFGPLAQRFESTLAGLLSPGRPPSVVAVSSATLGLELALRAMALPAASQVLLPSLTFPATALAVVNAGHIPLFADVDPETWMLEPAGALRAMECARVDAVVPVAAFGYPPALDAWREFRAKTGVPVLVDAAGALGVLPATGEVPVVFSLHATKPLGAGEGGAVVTADADLADEVRRLANFGFRFGEIVRPGTNAKFSEYLAAVGLAQLARAPEVLAHRRRVLDQYRARLDPALLHPRSRECPAVLPVNTKGRAEAVAAALMEARIEVRRWYVPPLHRHRAFRRLLCAPPPGDAALEVTGLLARSLVGIPFHARLEEREVDAVAAALRAALGET